jgi:endonuclease/exonuclease/phosphatase family metal-dependent hydrolase
MPLPNRMVQSLAGGGRMVLMTSRTLLTTVSVALVLPFFAHDGRRPFAPQAPGNTEPAAASVECSLPALPGLPSGEFVALTYNVAGLPEGISKSQPARFTPLIAPRLNRYDLVLVQESWLTPEPNPLWPLRVYHEILLDGTDHPHKSEPAPHPLGSDPDRPQALVSDGLNRFSRLPFEPVVRRKWEDCFDSAGDCLAQKGFSVARTTLAPGATIDVYNLHMEAGNHPEDERLRDEAVTQLLAFLAEYSAGQALIVGGDFNLRTEREPDASQFARLLAAGGLTDACAALDCPVPGNIDKFLFRSSDTVTIVPTSWRFESDVFQTGGSEPLSDHKPLAVRFAWSKGRRFPLDACTIALGEPAIEG